MRKFTYLSGIVFLFAILFGISSVSAAPNDVIENDKSATGYLFVISSTKGKVEGNTLTLSNVPNVIYFTDRPKRKSGHIMVEEFLTGWKNQEDDLTKNPPNAVLSVMSEEGNQNIVVVLEEPEYDGEHLKFKIKTMNGETPKEFKSASLFIDPVNQNGMWTGTFL